MKIKIVNLNIEGDKHLPEVIGLVERERPDLLCFQEIFQTDFNYFSGRFKMKGVFSPTVFIDQPGKPGFGKRGVYGIAMIGRLPGKFGSGYYFKRRGQGLPVYGGKPNSGNRAVVWQKINNGPTVAATHFTWSKAGQTTEKQRQELKGLIKLLVRVKPDVVNGDFNAPRGGEIWTKLTERFVDNIPAEIKTTLDPKLHYANGVELVVDGFFTAPKNKTQVKSLRLVNEVSDHLAIVAEII